MHNIKHKNFTASINPVGAELSSLQSDNKEFIWQGDEKFWTGRAPILFPIVGALKDGAMTYRGKQYKMPRHGIVRLATFEIIEQTDSSITMHLLADNESRAVYPWDFELRVQFSLHDNGIKIQYTVLNHDTTDMLFTIGSHPAFALEINDRFDFHDYQICFDKPESLKTYSLNAAGLLDTRSQAVDSELSNSRGDAFRLSREIFNQDALVFRDINSGLISLKREDKTLLSVDTGGAPHLGIWAKPEAPYVCIEPWLGTSDFTDSDGDFENKLDLQILAPKAQFSHAIAISLLP